MNAFVQALENRIAALKTEFHEAVAAGDVEAAKLKQAFINEYTKLKAELETVLGNLP